MKSYAFTEQRFPMSQESWFSIRIEFSRVNIRPALYLWFLSNFSYIHKFFWNRCLKPCVNLWWVNPGWILSAHQSCSITFLLIWTRERMKGSGVKDERSLTSSCHRQNKLCLGKTNLIYYQTNQSRIKRNKTKPSNQLLLTPPFSLCFNITPNFF